MKSTCVRCWATVAFFLPARTYIPYHLSKASVVWIQFKLTSTNYVIHCYCKTSYLRKKSHHVRPRGHPHYTMKKKKKFYHHWWTCMLIPVKTILLWNSFCFAHFHLHPAKSIRLASVFYYKKSGSLYFLFFLFSSSPYFSLPSPSCQHFSFLFDSFRLSFCYLSITSPLLTYWLSIKGHPWLQLGGH